METNGGGLDQSGPRPNIIPETHMAPELSEQPPSKEGGASALTATPTNPEAPNALVEALRNASIMEEHRTLMGVVVEKVQSFKSGLNEAFTIMLISFKVCDVILLDAFHMKEICMYIDTSPRDSVWF